MELIKYKELVTGIMLNIDSKYWTQNNDQKQLTQWICRQIKVIKQMDPKKGPVSFFLTLIVIVFWK